MSNVHARSHQITNKPLRVRTTKTLPTITLRSVPQILKRWRIIVNRISKERQTTCNWIKKILDEATRIVNVFLISWFLNYFFSFCSVSLLVKYDFILRYEAWVNAIRAYSFFENFPQISAKPIAFQQNLLLFFTNHFFSETDLENSREIPSKSAVFSANLSLKIPRNLTFFPRPTRSPDMSLNQLELALQKYNF